MIVHSAKPLRRIGAFAIDLGLWSLPATFGAQILLAPLLVPLLWFGPQEVIGLLEAQVLSPAALLVAALLIAATCVFLALSFDLYFLLLEKRHGATYGKALLGLRVEARNGQAPTLGQGILRLLFRWLEIVLFPFSFPLWFVLGERLGDRVAGTVVPSDPARPLPDAPPTLVLASLSREQYGALVDAGPALLRWRLLAGFLDYSVVCGFVSPLLIVVSLCMGADVTQSWAGQLGLALLPLLAFPAYESLTRKYFGATVARRILALRVEGATGAKSMLREWFLRWFLPLVTVGTSLFPALLSPDSKTLTDSWTGTRVRRLRAPH